MVSDLYRLDKYYDWPNMLKMRIKYWKRNGEEKKLIKILTLESFIRFSVSLGTWFTIFIPIDCISGGFCSSSEFKEIRNKTTEDNG